MSVVQSSYEYSQIHPKKFALWVSICSIIMMFAGLTSAYIVRKAAGDWVSYQIPSVFTLSTVLVVLSSWSLHYAYVSKKKENHSAYHIGLFTTSVLAFAFVALQWMGWVQLQDIGIRLTGNPSGAFLFVIAGLHALHLIGGLVLLLIVLFKSIGAKDPVQGLMDETNPDRHLGIELLMTYWHFVGILWLYLFCFFWYNSL